MFPDIRLSFRSRRIPSPEQEARFPTEAKQHRAIHAAIDGVVDYIRRAGADWSAFDGKNLERLMQNLRDPLVSMFPRQ
jgi:hypothetical protein